MKANFELKRAREAELKRRDEAKGEEGAEVKGLVEAVEGVKI